MSLREQLLEDLKAAMRAGDKVRVSTLRYLRSAVGYAEVEKQQPLADPEVVDIISRQVRQRNESIREFELGKRADLVAQERAEMEILLGYLPLQASRDEIVAAARLAIEEVGATESRQVGRVMQVLMPRLKGRAEGAAVSEIVRQLLCGAVPQC